MIGTILTRALRASTALAITGFVFAATTSENADALRDKSVIVAANFDDSNRSVREAATKKAFEDAGIKVVVVIRRLSGRPIPTSSS